jgi:hypothetical protein
LPLVELRERQHDLNQSLLALMGKKSRNGSYSHMASRAEALAANLRVRSMPGAGSTVEICFPAPVEAPTS